MTNWQRTAYWSVILLIALFINLYAAYGEDFVKSISGQTAAAWVQAVGSIVAIIVAWRGITHQLQHGESARRKDKAERDEALARACLHCVMDAYAALKNIDRKMANCLETGNQIVFGPERIDSVQSHLRTMIEKDLPATIVPVLLRVQREVAYTAALQRRLRNGDDITHMSHQAAVRRRTQVAGQALALRHIVHGGRPIPRRGEQDIE